MDRTSMELEGDRAIVISRTFAAPARIVFDAWTRADLVARWWAPASLGVTIVSIEADVRVGGRYRYVARNRDGAEVVFSGEYSEVTRPTRLVYTSLFEAVPSPPAIITVTLTEEKGRTRLVGHELYPSAEVRDMVIASGMEHGMREVMDQLDALVGTLS